MSRCDFSIEWDKEAVFYVAEQASGKVHISVNQDTVCHKLSVRAEWRTHGRGNRDKGTLPIIEHTVSADKLIAGQSYTFPFNFTVSSGPLSYRGHYFNVDWYLKAVIDARGPFDPSYEQDFIVLPSVGQAADPRFSGILSNIAKTNLGSRPSIFMGLFSLIFIGFGLFWFIFTRSVGNAPAFFPFFGLVFVVVGGILFYGNVRNFLAQQQLKDIKVELDKNILIPDEAFTCNLSFNPSRNLTMQKVRFKLIGKEQVVSGSGTKRKTYTHNIFEGTETQLEDSFIKAGESQTLSQLLHIPENAPYSFSAPDNKFIWQLEVVVDAKGVSNWVQTYPLSVIPWKAEN
ncbi:MAG: hypothetical protein R2880_19870 [Deinococcales bacterium]